VSEIADFLRARYADRRAAIEAMPRGPWNWVKAESDTGDYEALCGPDGEVLGAADSEGYKAWIEKHDALDGFLAAIQPNELLADLDAKLALIDEHGAHEVTAFDAEGWERTGHACHACLAGDDWPCRTLRFLAQPFAGHPDHKGEEWAP